MNAVSTSDLRALGERAATVARETFGRARENAPSAEELRRTLDEALRSVGLERRRPPAARMRPWPFVAALIAGASLVFFLDPESGRRRRALARDRALAAFRDALRVFQRLSRLAGSRLYGASQKLAHPRPEAAPGETSLVDRVLSEAFRGLDPDLRGRVNVNAVGGVVYVRGEIDRPQDIDAIEARVRGVAGVEEVENLLHLTGTPAR